MALLLDTHLLLWALSEPERIAPKIRRLIEDPKEAVFVSAASLWEIGIKTAVGKLKMPKNLEAVLMAARFSPLSVTWTHAMAAGNLPMHHKDPFDRMLIAQAQVEDLSFLTHDRRLKPYGSFVQVI